MKVGRITQFILADRYHEIDSHPVGYVMYEHNERGEELILVVNESNGSYCWTDETLQYTITNKDEFTWYLMGEE